ncbi:MAG: ATP-dependent helicase, partial [Spirochaetota bacterium]
AGVLVSTFHALGRHILAEHAEETGRTPGFLVAGEHDRLELVSRAAGRGAAERWVRRVSEAKRDLLDPDRLDPQTAGVLRRYEALLAGADAFDLDDLVAVPARLLRSCPALARAYRERFRWVLIDEYQDINRAQYELIRALAPGPRANLFVIGDPNQAIYGFRGADPRYIDRFLEDYPGAAVYALEHGYRCSSPIFQASRGLLEGPGHRVPAGGRAGAVLEPAGRSGGEGPLVRIVSHRSDRSEAEFVARTIEQLMGGLRFFSMDSAVSGGEETDWSLQDFAVLCRLREQMDPAREAFRNHGIPCQPVDTEPFYRKEPACFLADLLAWAASPRNPLPGKRLERYGIAVGEDPPRLATGPVRENARRLAVTYLGAQPDPEGLLERFYGLCVEFGEDLQAMLRFLETGTGEDTYRLGLEEVSLLTLHASKGLEFRCVFILGCEEGIIPCTLPGRKADPDEERRLLYVGMTRARELLVLNHADRRVLYGREMRLPRSRLVDGILEQLEAQRPAAPASSSRRGDGQMELF